MLITDSVFPLENNSDKIMSPTETGFITISEYCERTGGEFNPMEGEPENVAVITLDEHKLAPREYTERKFEIRYQANKFPSWTVEVQRNDGSTYITGIAQKHVRS